MRENVILDYCRELFDTLENLEGLLKGSEDLREDYRKKISPQIARQASILDILVSIGMIVYFMPDKTVFFSNLVPGTGPVDLFFRMSAITFLSLLLGYGSRLGLTWLWQHNYLPGGRKHIARFYKKKYLKKQNVINLYYKREKSQVTINFLDSDNTGLKVQKSETMTVNVGEYVWPINYGAMTSQSTKSVYHMYQIPTILNYSYQNSDSDTPLLVANDSATNVINLYYKRDKSQVTVEFLDTKGKSIRANDTITANVGDYIWIVSLGVNSEQMKFGVYWYFVPKIGGYSFNHGTPIKVSKDAGSNIVKLYYDTEYSFDYEYDKGTPNQSSPLPDSFVAKKDDVIMSNLPEGYFISEVIDNNGKSYTDPEVAISQQEDTSPKSFKIIVSAKESNLKLTVNKPVGGESTKEFSGLYGETYQIPIDEILTTNGKTYRAIVKIQKVDWKNGITTTIIEDPEEIASLLKGNLLVGKYDSQTTSISVSYKEKAAIPPLPSKDEGDEGDDSSPSTPAKSIESSKQNEPDKQKGTYHDGFAGAGFARQNVQSFFKKYLFLVN